MENKQNQYEGHQPLFTQFLAALSTISEKMHFIMSENMRTKQHRELERVRCWKNRL